MLLDRLSKRWCVWIALYPLNLGCLESQLRLLKRDAIACTPADILTLIWGIMFISNQKDPVLKRRNFRKSCGRVCDTICCCFKSPRSSSAHTPQVGDSGHLRVAQGSLRSNVEEKTFSRGLLPVFADAVLSGRSV